MTAILLGLLLGVRHALDADHVVAVSTIVSRERSLAAAARVGAWWGVGHSAMICTVGGVMIVLRVALPPRLALAFEFIVALMLIVLGVANVMRGRADAAPGPGLPPVVIGLVHGLAGSAALALLVLAAVPGTAAGLTYLAVFSAGTIAGMVAVTAAIALPLLATARRIGTAQRYIRVAAGVASIALGLVMAHEIGVTHQLFGPAPQWAPE